MAAKVTRNPKAIAKEIVRLAESAQVRVTEDGEVMGWRGFHLDLDALESEIATLRLAVRGVGR